MNNREFLVQNIEAELPRFERVFLALPEDKLSWRPHERSKSAMELVTSMALEAIMCPIFMKSGVVDYLKLEEPKGKSVAECWSIFKQNFEEMKNLVSKMTEEDWGAPSKLVAGDTAHWETTKGWMAWGMLLDLIHHRGQLSTYIRPMGGKVPSIYGPSADVAE